MIFHRLQCIMAKNNRKIPCKGSSPASKGGRNTRKRRKLGQNSIAKDISMSKTTSGDFQDEEEDNDEENDEEDEGDDDDDDDENEGDDDDDDADEEDNDDDDDEEEEEKRNNFMKEDAWTEFRKGSNEEIGKRCRAVCKLAFSESLRREHNVPADLQLEKSARSWLSVYKKDGDWSELKKRTWAVYSFFRSEARIVSKIGPLSL